MTRKQIERALRAAEVYMGTARIGPILRLLDERRRMLDALRAVDKATDGRQTASEIVRPLFVEALGFAEEPAP